jgi:hypothetical protein
MKEGVMAEELPPGRSRPTREVGDEGGTPGDVELDRSAVTTGSEATATVDAEVEVVTERRHDETGEGRRSP